MPRRLYPAVVHSDDGSAFGVSLVDFPVHAGGRTVEAAIADAGTAIAETVESLLASGASVPHATAVADIPAEAREGAERVILVPVHLPDFSFAGEGPIMPERGRPAGDGGRR